MTIPRTLLVAPWLLTALLAAGCGGGGSSSPPASPPGAVPAHYAITRIGTLPGFPFCVPDAFNAHGQIVGTLFHDQNTGGGTAPDHPFLYAQGRMQDLGTLPGFTSSYATGIDDAGDVVGYTDTYPVLPDGSHSSEDAFVARGGAEQDLGTLGGTQTGSVTVSAAGVIAGTSETAAGAFHAFLVSGGKLLDLGVPPGFQSSGAVHVTASGDILGQGLPVGGAMIHALRWHQGVWTDLGPVAAATPLTQVSGANDAGQFIGSTGTSASDHAYLYSQGALTDLGTLPGNTLSYAGGINAAGVVVGSSQSRAFVDANGKMQDLNDLIPAGSGWTLESASAINDAGVIVGEGIYQGTDQAYLLTPAP